MEHTEGNGARRPSEQKEHVEEKDNRKNDAEGDGSLRLIDAGKNENINSRGKQSGSQQGILLVIYTSERGIDAT
jgi:hypothetical protein